MNIGKEIHTLNIDDVLPNRFQPRISFNDSHINELADSIKEHGVIQPIVVRKLGDKYEIIAGERRYKASIIAGKTTIPAIISELDDKKSAEVALIENVQRQDLSAIEEAISYKKILDMGYLTQNQLADKLGRSQSTIANKLRLLNLDEDVQEALLDSKISERHARSLLKLPKNKQVTMLNKIISDRLTVRNADKEIKKLLEEKESTSKVIEKEEKSMNEQIFEKYNIPNNPIKEEEKEVGFIDITKTAEMPKIVKEEKIEETIMPEVKETEAVNPGFMDIEKIESTAEDIFKPEEKSADVEKLLEEKEEKEEVVESPMAPIPTEEVSKPKGNRFFTMFDTPEEDNFVENLEKVETNMDFGIPKKEDVKTSDELEKTVVIDPIKPTEKEETLETKKEENNVNIFDLKYTVNEIPAEEPVQEEVVIPEVKAVEEVKTVEPVMAEIESVKPESDFNIVNTFSLNDDEEFESTLPNLKTTEVQEAIKEVEQPVEVVMPEVKVVEEVKTVEPTKEQSNNFRTAINTIRNCADTLERFGFNVEVDEMDLENTYQVTFKINK